MGRIVEADFTKQKAKVSLNIQKLIPMKRQSENQPSVLYIYDDVEKTLEKKICDALATQDDARFKAIFKEYNPLDIKAALDNCHGLSCLIACLKDMPDFNETYKKFNTSLNRRLRKISKTS